MIDRVTLHRNAVILRLGAESIGAFSTAAILASLLATPGVASAQSFFDRDGNVPVLSRPRPDYEALGLREGAWIVYPKLTLDASYDDNIYASGSGRQSDEIFLVRPDVLVQSDWNQNYVSIDANATLNRYSSHASENTTQYQLTGLGRLDALRDLTFNGELQAESSLIPRTSAAYTELSVNPLQFYQDTASVTALKQSDRFKFTSTLSVYAYTYLNGSFAGGGTLNEHFRDSDLLTGLFRVDYAVSPDIAMFLEESLDEDRYVSASNRNSSGTATLAGVNFQLTHLTSGEVGLGYLTNNYHSPGYHNTKTLHGRAQLQWFPTQLVTVTISGAQGLYDSGLLTSPAYLSQLVTVQADYELLRNVIVTAKAADERDQYVGISRTDNPVSESVLVNYLVNRSVGISLQYAHTKDTSSGISHGVSFTDDRVGLVLTLQR